MIGDPPVHAQCDDCRTSTVGYCTKHTPGVFVSSANVRLAPWAFGSWTAPTGWVCPKCGRCYSPTTTMCATCVGSSYTVTGIGTGFPNLNGTIITSDTLSVSGTHAPSTHE